MILEIAYYGNPVLRQKAKPVMEITPEIRQLIDDLFETMDVNNGVGLAAPQVNVSLRIFVTNVPIENEDGNWEHGTKRVFINPRIVSVSDELELLGEGCISIPKIYADIERPAEVTVEAQDLDGKIFQLTLNGLEGRCILHENDHINGKLFIDRIDKKERNKIEPLLREIKNKYN